MRRLILTLGAAAALVPASASLPLIAASAQARPHHTYSGHAVTKRCRYSKGTAGLIAGGVTGAVVGGSVIGGGVVGPLIGAAGGALAGRAVDRSMTAHRRCSYSR